MRSPLILLLLAATTCSTLAQPPLAMPPAPRPNFLQAPFIPQPGRVLPPGAVPVPGNLPPGAVLPPNLASGPVPSPPGVLVAPAPKPTPFWGDGWCGGVEFGVNGADGNSQNFKLRGGLNLKQETPDTIWKNSMVYSYATANSTKTENRLLAETRYEWLLRETPWSTFVDGSFEYNEFTVYNVLLAGHAGVGYQVIKTEATQFKLRAGAGGSVPFGGPRDGDFAPEALAGTDLDWKISDRQKLCSTFDFYPDLKETGQYRFQAKLAYEVLIDPTWNLTLKLGVMDRYFSNVALGKKRNDVEYFGVLLWKF